jgi:hypothetical protein
MGWGWREAWPCCVDVGKSYPGGGLLAREADRMRTQEVQGERITADVGGQSKKERLAWEEGHNCW